MKNDIFCIQVIIIILFFFFFVEGVRIKKKVGKDEIADYQYQNCEKCVSVCQTEVVAAVKSKSAYDSYETFYPIFDIVFFFCDKKGNQSCSHYVQKCGENRPSDASKYISFSSYIQYNEVKNIFDYTKSQSSNNGKKYEICRIVFL